MASSVIKEIIEDPAKTQAETRATQVQDEITSGLREPISGNLYCLDRGKHHPLPASSSSSSTTPPSIQISDGGASWKAKMLRRAKERAVENNSSLHEVRLGRPRPSCISPSSFNAIWTHSFLTSCVGIMHHIALHY